MKRKIIEIILIIVCFMAQFSVLRLFALASIAPNLLVIITSSFGFMCGKKEGMFIGFISGLLMDLYCGDLLGFYSLVFLLLGYANGLFRRLFYDEDVKLPIALIAASEFLYGVVMYLFLFMMRSRFEFGKYLGQIIIPELVYTILVTLVLYPFILKLNHRLVEEEKRSASKFV